MLERGSILVATLVALLLLLTAGGCPTPAPKPGGGEAGENGAAGELKVAKDFELVDMDGNTFKLSETHGKVRLLDFWATFCAPCVAAMPFNNELQEKYGDDGFLFVGIAIDEEGESLVGPILEKKQVAYRNLLDSDGAVSGEYGVLGMPDYWLIDREGRVVERWLGTVPHKVVEDKIRETLGLSAEDPGTDGHQG